MNLDGATRATRAIVVPPRLADGLGGETPDIVQPVQRVGRAAEIHLPGVGDADASAAAADPPELVARRAAVLITAGATLAHGMDAGHVPGRVRAERLYAQRAVVGDRQRASRPASSTVGLVVVVIPVPRAAEARCRNQAADRAWIRRGGQGYGAVIGDRHGAPGAGASLVDASATHCVCHDDTADGIPGHGVRETGAGRVRRLGVDRYARSGITVLLILVIDTTVAPTGRPCVSIVDLADRLGCISIATRIRLAGQGRPAETYGQHD